VLEIMLNVEPEKSEPIVTFRLPECFTIYTFILTTIPIRTADIVERITPITASSGR
jgi:hypothetical protein